jgi:large subunit ribosomal protein L4
MKLDVIKLDGGKGGSIELSDEIFGIEEIRADILQRMVTWQLAKRRAGTHKIQVRNEVSRTSKKMYKQNGSLVIVDTVSLKDPKTAALRVQLGAIGITHALVITGVEVDKNFGLAARNIPNVDVLPNAGLNVYDVLRRRTLVLTKDAVEAINARFQEKEAA